MNTTRRILTLERSSERRFWQAIDAGILAVTEEERQALAHAIEADLAGTPIPDTEAQAADAAFERIMSIARAS